MSITILKSAYKQGVTDSFFLSSGHTVMEVVVASAIFLCIAVSIAALAQFHSNGILTHWDDRYGINALSQTSDMLRAITCQEIIQFPGQVTITAGRRRIVVQISKQTKETDAGTIVWTLELAVQGKRKTLKRTIIRQCP